jgi:hypothetical protein
MADQPKALRLADALEQQFPVGTAQHYLDGEAAAELRRLEAENARLRAWQQSAWQRGHAVGLNGLNEALRQMEEHRKSDAWGNTQLTEALLRAEEQRDELLEALKECLPYVGQTLANTGSMDAYHTEAKACAAIAKATGEQT